MTMTTQMIYNIFLFHTCEDDVCHLRRCIFTLAIVKFVADQIKKQKKFEKICKICRNQE